MQPEDKDKKITSFEEQLLQLGQMPNQLATITKWRKALDLPALLISLGEDLNREGLQETPRRIAKAWRELFEGYTMKPEEITGTKFASEGRGIQVCRNIHFSSMCEHHILPFYGYAQIAYQPDKYVLGLSKLARLVDCFAHRLQIQERLTQQIADAIVAAAEPIGVYILIHATHMCCQGRGIRRDRMDFVTSCSFGDIDIPQCHALLTPTN